MKKIFSKRATSKDGSGWMSFVDFPAKIASFNRN